MSVYELVIFGLTFILGIGFGWNVRGSIMGQDYRTGWRKGYDAGWSDGQVDAIEHEIEREKQHGQTKQSAER